MQNYSDQKSFKLKILFCPPRLLNIIGYTHHFNKHVISCKEDDSTIRKSLFDRSPAKKQQLDKTRAAVGFFWPLHFCWWPVIYRISVQLKLIVHFDLITLIQCGNFVLRMALCVFLALP